MINLANQQDLSSKTIKIIQQQLVLILHAITCMKRDEESAACVQAGQPSRYPPCNLPHCSTFRQLSIHMGQCPVFQPCAVPYCETSKGILNHWNQCQDAECSVCAPIRLYVK